jgi:cysteine desulfuration protein SufE
VSPLPTRLAGLVAHYAAISDRGERIQALIDLSDAFKSVPGTVAARPFPEANRVPACESEAFVFARPLPEQRLELHFAVENPQGLSAKAMCALLQKTLSGLPARDLVDLPADFVFAVFGNELSMGKGMGLMGIVTLVQNLARRNLAAGQPAGQPDASSSGAAPAG